jgi:hypothetical protein
LPRVATHGSWTSTSIRSGSKESRIGCSE